VLIDEPVSGGGAFVVVEGLVVDPVEGVVVDPVEEVAVDPVLVDVDAVLVVVDTVDGVVVVVVVDVVVVDVVVVVVVVVVVPLPGSSVLSRSSQISVLIPYSSPLIISLSSGKHPDCSMSVDRQSTN
jgi:hypothetical protein